MEDTQVLLAELRREDDAASQGDVDVTIRAKRNEIDSAASRSSASMAVPLTAERTIIVISDRVDNEGHFSGDVTRAPWAALDAGELARPVIVEGSYLERLPLACLAMGAYDRAEIWHHAMHPDRCGAKASSDPRMHYRGLLLDHAADAPFDNLAMAAAIQNFGAPHLLIVYGLGVCRELVALCANSVIVYNSIDAPALRVPAAVSGHFDLVLTGSPGQTDAVVARHPDATTLTLPVGPEFAGTEQFRPLGTAKRYDLIYVAAAQPYKRHDILFDAVAACPGVTALCVFGYGELADHYRDEIAARGLVIDCIGPPGLSIAEVNEAMNSARIGVVAGVDDGAPAILTEYQLAGLPVLCNADLVCGTGYVPASSGVLVSGADFAQAIPIMLADLERYTPRQTATAQWAWPVSAGKFLEAVQAVRPFVCHNAEGNGRC